MEKIFRVETTASPDQLFEIVSDLSTFPQWIEVVHKVDPAQGEGSGGEPTWWVILRAQIGPLARSKRLRMSRTVNLAPAVDAPGHVRFERSETDGRNHADWTMEVTVGPSETAGTSWAECRLFYGGSLWSGLLDGQLDAVADRATERLQHLATAA